MTHTTPPEPVSSPETLRAAILALPCDLEILSKKGSIYRAGFKAALEAAAALVPPPVPARLLLVACARCQSTNLVSGLVETNRGPNVPPGNWRAFMCRECGAVHGATDMPLTLVPAAPPASAAEPAPGVDRPSLTDEQLDGLILRALGKQVSRRLWDALTFDSGPYAIARVRSEVTPLFRAVVSLATASQAIGVVPVAGEKLEALFVEAMKWARGSLDFDRPWINMPPVEAKARELAQRAVGGAA